MKHLRLKIPLFLLLMVTLEMVLAAPLALYEAEVKVVNETLEQRNQALSAAMAKIMVKLSGSQSVLGHPVAASILQKAPRLVQQFKYRLVEAIAEADSRRYLWAKFDAVAVNQLFLESGISVWNSQRPSVLMWLAREQNGVRKILNLDELPQSRKYLKRTAERRGLALRFPLMDLQDQSALNVADLWADYERPIREASRRYSENAVLTARLRDLGAGRWQAKWTLLSPQESEVFSSQGKTWLDALSAGVNEAQDRLAEKFAPVTEGDDDGSLDVRFLQVEDRASYGRLVEILSTQSAITNFNLREAKVGSVLMSIRVRGGVSALTRGLSLSGELFHLEPPVAESSLRLPSETTKKVVTASEADMTFSLSR